MSICLFIFLFPLQKRYLLSDDRSLILSVSGTTWCTDGIPNFPLYLFKQ